MLAPRVPIRSHSPTPVISLLVIRCADIERSRSFYSLLGLDFVSECHANGPLHYAATLADGTVFELYPTDVHRAVGGVRIGFSMADMGACIERLESAGVVTIHASHRDDGARVVVVDDPDGNRVELTSPR